MREIRGYGQARSHATLLRAWPDYGRNKAGYIVLQDHNDPVWYRNIKVRKLD